MMNPSSIHHPSRRTALKLVAGAAVLPAFASCSVGKGKRTAVVIGAGIAGLSAAYDLAKDGFDVTIMEKWDFVGGRMRDAQIGPLHLMPHALGILQANKAMFALADEIGIDDQMQSGGDSDVMMVDNGHGAYPVGLRFHIDEISKIPGLSAATRAKLPLLQSDLDEIRAQVDPCLLATGARYDDETLAAYYRRKLGDAAAQEVLDYWIDSALAAWNWSATETSRIAFLAWVAQQQAKTILPKGGIGVLTRKLGELMPVSLNTSVRYITPPDSTGRHTVHYIGPDAQQQSVTPDVVVCATEGKFVPELVQGLNPGQRNFFRSIDFTKGVAVRYVLPPELAPKTIMQGSYTPTHPDPLKRRVWYWAALPAGLGHPKNPPTADISLSRDEFFAWQKSGQTAPDYCLPILKKLYPALDTDKIVDAVNLTSDGLIYMPQGYVRAMTEVLREQETGRKGLYFAGEYMAGAHTGAACASGRSVAKSIIGHWA